MSSLGSALTKTCNWVRVRVRVNPIPMLMAHYMFSDCFTLPIHDLYEFAFAMGGMTCPFQLHVGMPRRQIPLSSASLMSLDVASSLLTLEELDGGISGALDMFGIHMQEVTL